VLKDMTDVLIIGAGPTGMTLAIALAQAGIDHLIIDRLDQGQNTSRAGVIHAQTLESLRGLGVTDRLAELGLKLQKFAIRDRNRALLDLNFGNLPTQNSYVLMLPQQLTEKVLADRLAELGGTIHRGVEAKALAQEAGGVRVTVVDGGREREIFARYVVGGDGMHSVVRQAAGIGFDGAAYEHSFVLADVHMDWPVRRDEVSLLFSPAGLVVVAPLPGGTFRVVATLDHAPEEPTVADIQALIDGRGPTAGGRVRDVLWSSRFRVHHRLAETYRNGRLLLMGDAAHVHSPAGGQGMNTGMIDAVVLGGLLADVVKGKRPESALDLYEKLRRPAASEVLILADRLTGMATAKGAFKRLLRNLLLSVVDWNPIAKRRIAMAISGLSRGESAKAPS
jgi:2-polyprenyl-6-methoxyphenol hydroxylase-like FAD-dependent oxidoreductase